MPYIVTTSLYPTDKAMEAVKKYLETLKKYPPDQTLGTEVVPAAVKTTEQGVKAIRIFEVKEGKLEKALTRTANEMVVFQSVVGFEYSIDVYFTLVEAMATVGMSLPG